MPRGRQAPKVLPGPRDSQVEQDPKANQESPEHQEHPGLREHRGCPDCPVSLEQKGDKGDKGDPGTPADVSTLVTLATAQTITGAKTLGGTIKMREIVRVRPQASGGIAAMEFFHNPDEYLDRKSVV